MVTVILPSSMNDRTRGARQFDVEAGTAGEALRALDRQVPAAAGWVLDERGRLRRHIKLFRNEDEADMETPVGAGDELFVVRAVSGGKGKSAASVGTRLAAKRKRKNPVSKTTRKRVTSKGKGTPPARSAKSRPPRGGGEHAELLVGTQKGLIILRGGRGGSMKVVDRLFPGQTVEYAIRDPRSGRYFAAITHGQHGPRLFWSDNPGVAWEQAEGPVFPADAGAAVERIWVVEPAVEAGTLWAGVAPAALFRSADGGLTWSLNRGLWDLPSRPQWQPGGGGLCLHTICPWPGDPRRLAVGVSAVGVWLTDDGGETWRSGNRGIVPRYLPEEAREQPHVHCVHDMERAPLEPETIYMQFHGGVYRSDDAGESWIDIGANSGLPADFGFPLAIDPADPASAFVIPMTSDEDRVTTGGNVRVYETRDRGASWQPRGKGLPANDAYLTVLRQAFCADGKQPLGLYFGARSGELFGSADGGATWATVAAHLPPILSVRVSS